MEHTLGELEKLDDKIGRIEKDLEAFRSRAELIEDGSYLRLKNVTIGYTFPSKLVKKWKIDKARVYVAAQNLWTCTGYSGYDPEVSVRNSALTPGLDYSSYPRAYSVSFGVSLGF